MFSASLSNTIDILFVPSVLVLSFQHITHATKCIQNISKADVTVNKMMMVIMTHTRAWLEFVIDMSPAIHMVAFD